MPLSSIFIRGEEGRRRDLQIIPTKPIPHLLLHLLAHQANKHSKLKGVNPTHLIDQIPFRNRLSGAQNSPEQTAFTKDVWIAFLSLPNFLNLLQYT